MKSRFLQAVAGILATIMLLQASAVAADRAEALVRYAKGDHAGAIVLLRVLADRGDAVCQEIVANMYFRGEGVARDNVSALYWYRLASAQGRTDAQFQLGVMYRDGLGTPPDGRLAMHWFQAAADRGAPHAFNAAGELYLGHSDIQRSPATALDWFLRGARLDNSAAMYNLGILYILGHGVVRDEVEAYKWFDLAAAAGVGDDRDKAVLARQAVAERLTPLQVESAKVEARQWLLAAQPPEQSPWTPHRGQPPDAFHPFDAGLRTQQR
jgi:TPR repeat protein